ncbi:MAG: CoA transferase [Chloroflexi bacterium]|nr:CoA transferase [Chloroflexota bacterium]
MPGEALQGLRVVELGGPVAAPFCGRLMSLLGAEVIKIEPPGTGDPARHHGPFLRDMPHHERSGLFLALNLNKKGVTLDVSKAEGRKVLLDLLQKADILVESQPPKQMEQWRLDFRHLHQINPRLIVTSVTPFGWTGPYRDYKGYDINSQSLGGMTEGLGRPPREPLAYPYSQAALQGGLSGACATFIAILNRDETDAGQHVDISEAEVIATLQLGVYATNYMFVGMKSLRGVISGSRLSYPTGFTNVQDGYMYCNAPQLAQWLRFLEILGNPEWTKNPRYRDRRAMASQYPQEVDALLAPWFMARTREEVFKACQEKRVPYCPVYNIGESMENPQIKARGFLAEAERPDTGPIQYPGLPVRFSETPWRITSAAPLLGEHNEEVYCGLLGMDRKRLVQLREEGVI